MEPEPERTPEPVDDVELIQETPDEVWALVASFIRWPRDLGRLSCVARRFTEPVIRAPEQYDSGGSGSGGGSEAKWWSVVEEGARLQVLGDSTKSRRSTSTIAEGLTPLDTATTGLPIEVLDLWQAHEGELSGRDSELSMLMRMPHGWDDDLFSNDLEMQRASATLTPRAKEQLRLLRLVDSRAALERQMQEQETIEKTARHALGLTWLQLLGESRPSWKVEALVFEGEKQMGCGGFTAAVSAFRKAEALDSENAEIQTALAQAEAVELLASEGEQQMKGEEFRAAVVTFAKAAAEPGLSRGAAAAVAALLTEAQNAAHRAKIAPENELALAASAQVPLFANAPSAIVGVPAWADALDQWLPPPPREDMQTELQLLYRASRDGWKSQDFHAACDGIQGATLVVIREIQGHVFGGFTETSWGSQISSHTSPQAFIYSLSNPSGAAPSRMPLKNPAVRYAVMHDSAVGPCFGSYPDLCVAPDAHLNDDSSTSLYTYDWPTEEVEGERLEFTSVGDRHACPQERDGETFLTGACAFRAAEVEVFRVW